VIDSATRLRTLLFVPANRSDRVAAAAKWAADAVVIDLEDSVPADERDGARRSLLDNVHACRDGGQPVVIVRPSLFDATGALDIEAAARAGADALMLPRATRDVVGAADAILNRLGCPTGLIPIFETPAGIVDSLGVIDASSRVVGVFGGGVRNGDTHRFVGFEWSVQGLESLYIRSQIVLHARARGLRHVIGGATVDIDDMHTLQEHARSFKVLGYSGYVVLHPKQISPVHEVFSPSQDEIERARRVVSAMERAHDIGLGSGVLDGEIISAASLRMAHDVLNLACQ
jgi:citrate lyase subunit beta/citryl-CoA lyase